MGKSVLYRITVTIVTFSILLIIADCSGSIKDMDSAAESRPPRVLGGPCEYKQYKGKATIVAVHKKEMPGDAGRSSYDPYEVRFSFFPDEEIEETYGKVEGREYRMMLKNSSYPGPKFLEKYGIEAGKSFDCYLKVIIRGTCTPVLFDFTTIDLSDYFEQER